MGFWDKADNTFAGSRSQIRTGNLVL